MVNPSFDKVNKKIKDLVIDTVLEEDESEEKLLKLEFEQTPVSI